MLKPATPRSEVTTVTVASTTIAALRAAVWDCQHHAGLPASKVGYDIHTLMAMPVGFRAWTVGRWHHRLNACRTTLTHTLPATNDWQTAVRLVDSRVYQGSGWWLLSCSASEGGHGAFVFHDPNATAGTMNGESVRFTPGGQMQYQPGTFWHDFDAAVQELHARGVRVPHSAFTWYSPLGQAIAGGWAYGHDRPAGKWTGSGCS